MDLETIVKRIDDLENQLSSIKKAITSQNQKVNQVEEKTMSFLETAREQNNELSRITSSFSSLGQFDTEIAKLRFDINRQIEDTEKRIQLNNKMQEKIHSDEIKSLNLTIDKLKKDLIEGFDQKIHTHNEESSGQAQRLKELDSLIESKISDIEDFKTNQNLYQQESRQNKKMLTSAFSDLDVFKKKMDDVKVRLDILTRDMKTFDNRLNEVIVTETERKNTFIAFIEQQSLTGNERERIWNGWSSQFEESINHIYKLIPQLQNQQNEMKKTKDQFDEITQKFDRRANEITEMYRLMDEKFRKEWATFKTDLEKRWSNISLVLDDKQGGSEEKFQKMTERIVEVEDETREIQEALLLMSREIQKGMQSLMNMVNGWMEAFGQIKSR